MELPHSLCAQGRPDARLLRGPQRVSSSGAGRRIQDGALATGAGGRGQAERTPGHAAAPVVSGWRDAGAVDAGERRRAQQVVGHAAAAPLGSVLGAGSARTAPGAVQSIVAAGHCTAGAALAYTSRADAAAARAGTRHSSRPCQDGSAALTPARWMRAPRRRAKLAAPQASNTASMHGAFETVPAPVSQA